MAKLAPKVKDGTRCRPGSLDMCVDGKCLVGLLQCLEAKLINLFRV